MSVFCEYTVSTDISIRDCSSDTVSAAFEKDIQKRR